MINKKRTFSGTNATDRDPVTAVLDWPPQPPIVHIGNDGGEEYKRLDSIKICHEQLLKTSTSFSDSFDSRCSFAPVNPALLWMFDSQRFIFQRISTFYFVALGLDSRLSG